MAIMLTFTNRDPSDQNVSKTFLLIQYFLTTIFLPVKELLIYMSFSYLYFYQANNLKRKAKRKDNNKNNNKVGGKSATAAGRVEEDNTNRLSLDTDGVNKLLSSEVEDLQCGNKHANI